MLGVRRILSEDHEALIGTYINRMSDIYSFEQPGCNLDTDLNNLDATEKGCTTCAVYSHLSTNGFYGNTRQESIIVHSINESVSL